MNELTNLLASDDALTRFGEALSNNHDYWRTHLASNQSFSSLILLRDWQGRYHLGVPRANDGLSREQKNLLTQQVQLLQDAIDALAHPDFVFYSDELIEPEAIWSETSCLPFRWMRADEDGTLYPTSLADIEVRVIERQVKEKVWAQTPPESLIKTRAVLFGIKGGVGRSSALLALAWYLADKGKKILVVDMDFESPGVSTGLLRAEDCPDYGLLDWFSANALNPMVGDQLIEQEAFIAKSSLNQLLTQHTQGEILIAPAIGKKTQDYIGKLGRLYQDTIDINSGLTQSYAHRISAVVSALEDKFLPDVVLIDSRAGIDDTASVLLTQLNAECFMFATNGRQTWVAYELLFAHWQRKAQLTSGGEDFRSRLKMVSALTPAENTAPGNFEALCSSSYDLFLNHLYEAQAANNLDAFTYEFDDQEAPHWPVRISWDESLRNFDPLSYPDQLVRLNFVFSEFLKHAEETLGDPNAH